MQPIPGWAYIVVGAMISGVSWYVRSQGKGKQAMLYFMIIGLIFIAVGVVRLVLSSAGAKSRQGDLTALNMQAQINRAVGAQPNQRPQGMQVPMPGQQPVQPVGMQGMPRGVGSPDMPLDPGRSIYARQGAMQQTPQQMPPQAPQQQFAPAQNPPPIGPGGNVMASNLFPYRGVKHDPRTGHHPQPAPAQPHQHAGAHPNQPHHRS